MSVTVSGHKPGPMEAALPERRIVLEGELDLHSVRALQAKLHEALGDAFTQPVVDAGAVTFIDSTALGALVHAAQRMRRQGRSLTLIAGAGPVLDLLELTGMADRFRLVAREPQAA